MSIVYEARARYDWWMAGLFVLPLPIGLGVVLALHILGERWGSVVVLADLELALGLLLWAMLPRRYLVTDEGIRIVVGWPLSRMIRYETVSKIRATRGAHALTYFGMTYAPSTKTAVEIKRSRGLSIVISPKDRERFLAEAAVTLERSRS